MTLIDEQNDLFINDSRFEIGMKLFNSCQWYKSHDVFEEIWHETGGPERQVLQAILQVAVAQLHLENSNLNSYCFILLADFISIIAKLVKSIVNNIAIQRLVITEESLFSNIVYLIPLII